MKLVGPFWGGVYHGKEFDLNTAEALADGVSFSSKGARVELQNKPEFYGYLGPMWDGERYFGIDGKWHYTFERVERDPNVEMKAVLRYETQEVYNELSK